MNEVITFRARADLSARENLANFINMARDELKLWCSYEGFDWDNNSWPTHKGNIRFHNVVGRRQHHTKSLTKEMTLSYPFINFAKSYLRYTQSIKQTQTLRRTSIALMTLEAALINLDEVADITIVGHRHFDEASRVLSTFYKDRAAIGIQLENIAKNIAKWRISIHGTKYWKHSFRGSNAVYISGQPKIKLPEDDALLALAEVFANGYTSNQDDIDIYVTSHACLLLSAPQRIGESLFYKTNFLRNESDSNGIMQTFLSYWAPKNQKYVRKEIPKTMSPHTIEAVNRILKITEEGRRLAKHYETKPMEFYRHKNCPDLNDTEILSPKEVVQALGLASTKATQHFIHREVGNQELSGWTLLSLWKEVVLPKHKRNLPNFPFQLGSQMVPNGVAPKMSESLMCFRYRQLSDHFKTSPILLSKFDTTRFTDYLSRRSSSQSKKSHLRTFFSKHGYKSMSLKSHQLRHYLNTLAQEAGLGIDDITKWSTRASQAQSRVYMHQPIRRTMNRIAEKQINISTHTAHPITENEYKSIDKGPVIVTRYGICSHDYTLTPCEKHSDCLSCSELLICKGHKQTLIEIQREFDQLSENLSAAKTAIDQGKKVANRWYTSHKKKHERLLELLKVLKDESIEDGTPIRMTGIDFSHPNRIITNKARGKLMLEKQQNEIEYSEEILKCLAILKEESDV